MKTLRQYSLQSISASLLVLGFCLQLSMPLIDTSLVYRFTSWLTYHEQIEVENFNQLLGENPSLSDLAHAAAQKSGDRSSESKTAQRMLGEFLTQTEAKQQQQSAAALNTPIEKSSNSVVPSYLRSGFLISIDPLRCKKSLTETSKAPVSQFIFAVQSVQKFQNPPTSGQSTLAP